VQTVNLPRDGGQVRSREKKEQERREKQEDKRDVAEGIADIVGNLLAIGHPRKAGGRPGSADRGVGPGLDLTPDGTGRGELKVEPPKESE
jgi:hypothetical protein